MHLTRLKALSSSILPSFLEKKKKKFREVRNSLMAIKTVKVRAGIETSVSQTPHGVCSKVLVC